jgi:FMN phosphatase YigB (HAD superfamily)
MANRIPVTEKNLIVLLDCGDTIIDEGTEIRDERDVVLSGDVLPGADAMVKGLVSAGYRVALVADGRFASFENLLSQHGLFELFETAICSEQIRASKPSPRMFRAALGALDLSPEDASRCVMVGNNLSRDIVGANRLGITSIHMAWTDRYPRVPTDAEHVPDHTITMPDQLLPLLDRLEAQLSASEAPAAPDAPLTAAAR